jgi:hypothetical protein
MSKNQPRKPAGTPAGGQWAPAPHAEPEITLRPVGALRPGDLVDLKGDQFADDGDNAALEYEYAEVLDVEQETPNCVRVDFDSDSVGFPTEHKVPVVGHNPDIDDSAP